MGSRGGLNRWDSLKPASVPPKGPSLIGFQTFYDKSFFASPPALQFHFFGFGASKIIFGSSSARKTFSIVEGPFEVQRFSELPYSVLGISGVPTNTSVRQ